VLSYVRSRQRLWTAVGGAVGLILVAWDAWAAATTFLPQYAIRNDLRLAMGAALVGWQQGYGHIYDLSAQQHAIESLGSGFNPQPFISPPPLAWLVTPLLALPFTVAVAIWTTLLIAALVWAWYLLAPPDRPTRAAHLVLWLGLFPVAFAVMVGQPGPLVAAAVASAWWLIRKQHHLWAGVVLTAIVIKPQLALLVPLCLLLAGYHRVFGAWLAASAVVGVAALAMLGTDGVQRYLDVLAQTQTAAWDITRRYSISGPLGLGPVLNVVQGVVLVATLFTAWRQRGGGPEIPIAAGIAGSLLFTPYLGFQDFLMLVVAGWLLLRVGATPLQIGLLVVGYALLELALLVLAIPILVVEVALLVSLLVRPPAQTARDLRDV